MNDERKQIAWLVLLAVVAIAIVGSSRGKLFDEHARVTQKHDVYLLPPPKQLAVMSLGYRYAVADLLWAHVLVSQGLHSFERRRFENLLGLYDAINELDPTWRTPYLLADALITFNSTAPTYEEIVKARTILELGVKHRPNDGEIWLNLGQFVSYIAPASYLEPDRPDVAKRWRQEGARYLARAAELGGGNSAISWQALGAANILARGGETDAAIRFLTRTHAVTDDEELKANIEQKLSALRDKRAFEKDLARRAAFAAIVRADLPFVTDQTRALVLGPPPRPDRCAGPSHDAEPECATDWGNWSDRFDAAR